MVKKQVNHMKDHIFELRRNTAVIHNLNSRENQSLKINIRAKTDSNPLMTRLNDTGTTL